MSTYVITIRSSDNYSAYVSSLEPSTAHYDNDSIAYMYVSQTQSSLERFSNSALSGYRKKKINSIILHRLMNWAEGEQSGFSLSWLQSAVTPSSITYNNLPTTGWMGYYLAALKARGSTDIPIDYYQFGTAGLDGKSAPRNFIDQMPIGFMLGDVATGDTLVSINDRYEHSYFADGDVTFDTRPYLLFQMEDWLPTLTAQFPASGGYVNALAANTFTLAFDAFQSIDFPTVTQATAEIKDVVAGTVTTINATMSTNLNGKVSISILVPAGTMTKNKSYQWRGKLITDDTTTNFSAWADFTTSDAIPDVPTINYPSSTYLDAANPITLSWTHNISTGTTQYAYDVDYQQGSSWISLANHILGNTNNLGIPKNTLSADSFTWRVRTYNSDNVVGSYGTSAVSIVQAKPATPIIQSTSTAPRTTTQWQSVGQQAFEITIGAVKYYNFGTVKSFTIDTYLPDGNYSVTLRIQNSQGLWSEYATATVAIKNVPLDGDDVLSVEPVSGGVRLILSLPILPGQKYVGESYVGESYVVREAKHVTGNAYLLRDGIPIARVSGTPFTDYTGAGIHKYTYRATSDGYYYDSNTASVGPIMRYALIAPADSPQSFIPLAYNLGSKPVPERQSLKVYNSKYFSGRGRAVADITEHFDVSWSMDYSTTPENYRILDVWHRSGLTVLYRDHEGETSVGIISGLKMTRAGATARSLSLTLDEQNYSTEVAYV